LRKKKFAPPFFGIKRGKVGQWPAYFPRRGDDLLR